VNERLDRVADAVFVWIVAILAALLTMLIVEILVDKGAVLFRRAKTPAVKESQAVVVPAPARTNMPPGYVLEVNQAGLYRPLYDNKHRTPLLWFSGSGTRQGAIDRAWLQYEYEHPSVTDVWRVVECKTEGGAQ
jgi:hypothetical protein